MHPGGVCSICSDGGNVVADVHTGFYTCIVCGLVQDSSSIVSFCASLPDDVRKSVYKRIHHWHERMSQWCGQEPRIDPEIMALIEREARKRKYERSYGRGTIAEILRSVRVPHRLQEKFRSQKFKKLPMTTLNRFNEKWRTIQSRLTGEKMQLPRPDLLRNMRTGFLQLQPVFERVRHSSNCTGGFKCHKRFGCRHNFINYNYVIIKLIEQSSGKAEAERWSGCFKQISRAKRKKLDVMWSEMQSQIKKETRRNLWCANRPVVKPMPLPGRRLTSEERSLGRLVDPVVTPEELRARTKNRLSYHWIPRPKLLVNPKTRGLFAYLFKKSKKI